MVSSTFISNFFKMNDSAAEYYIYNLNLADKKHVVHTFFYSFLAFSSSQLTQMQIAIIAKRITTENLIGRNSDFIILLSPYLRRKYMLIKHCYISLEHLK